MYKIIILITLCFCINMAYAQGDSWDGHYICPAPSSLIIKNETYSGNASGYQVFSDPGFNPLSLSGESHEKLSSLHSSDAAILYRTQGSDLYYMLACVYTDNNGKKMQIQSAKKRISFKGEKSIIVQPHQSKKYGDVYGAAIKIFGFK